MKSVNNFRNMIIRITLTAILISFFPFQSFAQLSGAYTIDPAGGVFPNFTSFQAAVDSLLSPTQGVSGPVVFNIADGTYNEQIQLNQISGASAVNTITFQSASLDSTKVILTYSSSVYDANWTFRLNGADYVILRKMTFAATGDYYGRIININGTARYDTIENCQFFGYNTTSNSDYLSLIYSNDDNFQNLVIRNNLFADGSFGLRLDGDSQSNLSPGTKILNNVFIGQSQYGMWLRYHDAPVIKNNNISLDKDPAWGIRMEYCDNAFELSNNEIYFTKGDWGIYLYYCDGASLTKGLTANNFISIQGIGGNSSGIYLYNCTYQNIYHNSVYLSKTATGTASDNGAFGVSGSSNIDIRNNIFANFGGFYAYNVRTSTNVTSDYNNYFATGNFLANWTNSVDDLAALQAANSSDANSVSVNPAFLSTTDLHTTTFRLEGLGATDVGITTDIDGEARAGTFDMGADEFTGAGTALAGTYTIGGTTPDFATFNDAADSLFEVGISAPVTFNVRDGSYNEQVEILPIDGTDAGNTVTFQSETGDSTQVEISFNSGSANNYVVKFQGADYITFKKMTVSATNNTYSAAIRFDGSSSNDSLLNCVINSDITSTTYNGAVDSWQANVNNLVITNNFITGGQIGIRINSNNAAIIATGTKIINNEISDQGRSGSYGIYLRHHKSPEVIDNVINDPNGYSYYAINLTDCNDSLKILRNKITSDNTYGGIRLYNCTGTTSKRGLVANNFVDIGGTSTAYGIYTYSSDYQNIYYNSVRITSSHLTNGRAFYNSNSSGNIVLKNNIFSNFGGGYAFYTTANTDIDASSDYNDYYTTGNYIAYWDGANRNELSDFQTAASPREANSISANPSFVSNTDLHVTSSFVDGKGTPLTGVVDDDIDGEARDAANPDIGADEFTTATVPLAGGTYTIGGTLPSYATFADAADALNTLGISGPVIFDVRDGTYTEQISLLDINGADETNTITFQSESGDSNLVELTYSAGASYKYVVELIGTDYITFKNMTFSATGTTYSQVFYFRAGLTNVTISNCVINGIGTAVNTRAITSDNAVFTDLTIQNSIFSGGRTGIWLQCDNNNYSTGTRISNNSFSDHYSQAIYLRYHNAPKADSNYINNSTGSYYYGIQLQNCSNDLTVLKNVVNSTSHYGGIILYDCIGTTSKRGLVANNFVDIGGTSYAYGIYTTGSNYQRIYYNSVRITSTNTSYGRAYYNINGTNIDVQNNIFSNFGGGYAYYANNATAITTSDYNDLFTTGNYVGYYNGGNRIDLAAFQAASNTDANSLSVNPVFVSASDLHTTSSYIDSAGTVLAVITDDIDGEPRDATYPDIGADEFTPTEFPLAGEYTIGGTSPDYVTFTAAVEDLNNLGVNGPVTFNVRSDPYTEQIELFEIAGASVTNTIVFQSESGDSTDVILNYNAQSAGEDYVVKLTGADYITFQNMTFAATNSNYSRVVFLNGSVNNLNLLNNIFSADNSSYSSVIHSTDGNVTNNILIKQNIIIEGGTGIDMNGNNTTHSTGVQIIDNIINNQKYNGIYLEDQDGPVIIGNDISTSDYGYYGIYLNDCDEDMIVKANKITNDNYSYGIYLYYCNGTFVNQGLVANNFVSIQGGSYAYGIYMSNSEYQNIYYNSVNIASTYTYVNNKLAFYVTGGDYINVKNNIFANTKGGYAYYINTAAAVDASDNNDLYSTTDIAYWSGAARTDLPALQSASGMDASSVSVNPMFISETDLHVAQVALHQAATPVSEVTDDIDGTPRDGTFPDIGAMEFYCETPNFDVSVATVCFGDSSVFTDNSTNVASGSTYSWDFDTDFNPDTSLTTPGATIKHLFDTPGQHAVYFIITQIAGCNDYDTIYANVNPSPAFDIITQGAYCDSANGQAIIDVTQGIGPFSYYWSTGGSDSVATGLEIGIYTVAVSDLNNCSTTETFEIGDAIQVTVTEIKGSTCGISDGEAFVSVTGGVEPYSYVWSNGQTNDTSILLSPGVHYVNVIDANGCYAQRSVNIGNDGTGPQITLISKTDNSCYGDKLGSINIIVSGGSQPYSILWSNGATTEDIDSVVAGVYDVLITDNDGCLASASYEISQPALLNISAVVENASCAGSDGQAVAIVSGGTEPYLYSWSSGGGFQIEENLAAGIYSVTVTDANGCQAVKGVIVNNIGGPVVTIISITGVTCTDTTNGAIDISVSGGTPLYSYLWTPGSMSTQDVSNLIPGTYDVRVTDDVGCIGVNSAVIKQDPPAVNPICLVTVDSVSQKNLIVWEKEVTADVDHYNIYRETSQKGVYQLIGSIPIDSLSVFTDSIADPRIRSWKYKLSVVDKCDNESELSEPHKTMHLTQNLGLNNTVNLIWDHYEGFDFSTYEIYRYSSASDWEKLGEIASDLTSFTDLTPPSSGFFYYVVQIVRPTSCTATRKASTHKSSRSNRTVDLTTGVKAIPGNMANLSIYPNPSNGVFTLTFDMKKKEDVTIRMFDINGRLVHSIQYKNYFGTFRKTLDFSGLGSGLYFFQIVSETGIVYTQIVIE